MAPNEVYKLTIGEKQARQLSHFNDAVLSKVHESAGVFLVHRRGRRQGAGFLLKPPQYDPMKRFPVKFLIHGGPAGRMGR